MLGYHQPNSSCLPGSSTKSEHKDDGDDDPPGVAVIQIRVTTGAAVELARLWDSQGSAGSQHCSSIDGGGMPPSTAGATTLVDADVTATVHFDTATQLVRHAAADLAFVLRVEGDLKSGSAVRRVRTIPVRGRAVLETTPL